MLLEAHRRSVPPPLNDPTMSEPSGFGSDVPVDADPAIYMPMPGVGMAPLGAIGDG